MYFYLYYTSKGPSIKDVRSQGERGFVQSGYFADKGEGVIHFLEQKTSDFSKFMVCPCGQGGLSQCGHFADKRGVNFSRFCADVFYGRPLTQNFNNGTCQSLYRYLSIVFTISLYRLYAEPTTDTGNLSSIE